MTQTGASANAALAQAVRQLDLPLVLVDLRDLTIAAASAAASRFVGIAAEDFIGRPVLDVVAPVDRRGAQTALQAMGAGAIDFYRAHRRIGGPEHPPRPGTQWARAISIDGVRFALAEWTRDEDARHSPLARYLGDEPARLAVGRVNSDWKIVSVSCEIKDLLGIPATEVIGRLLLGAVSQESVQSLLDASRQASTGMSVALRVQLRDSEGQWRPMCCVLSPVAGSKDRLFILVDEDRAPVRDAAKRASELEQHLWRIAAEVEASGILQQVGQDAGFTRMSEMRALSVRQWEVLSRLARGERVAKIASELSISPSTVRNHLAAIFRRFGVHSQAELLEKLAKVQPDV